jgi:hypothetical protein
MSPSTTTRREGNPPSHKRAAKAGVAMSRTPWGVLERAKKSFSLEKERYGLLTGLRFKR